MSGNYFDEYNITESIVHRFVVNNLAHEILLVGTSAQYSLQKNEKQRKKDASSEAFRLCFHGVKNFRNHPLVKPYSTKSGIIDAEGSPTSVIYDVDVTRGELTGHFRAALSNFGTIEFDYVSMAYEKKRMIPSMREGVSRQITYEDATTGEPVNAYNPFDD
jgi:hypothetical protein